MIIDDLVEIAASAFGLLAMTKKMDSRIRLRGHKFTIGKRDCCAALAMTKKMDSCTRLCGHKFSIFDWKVKNNGVG